MDEAMIEHKLKFISDYEGAENAASGSTRDPNANVTKKTVATLTCELGKEDIIDLNRAITTKYIKRLYDDNIAIRYLADLKKHFIYRHDESSLMPYCCSISLYPYILNGLKDLGGSSAAPQHADSYIGGMINLIFMVAANFAGAVAIPEFLTYFDHFLRIDYGDEYIQHLDETIEIFGRRQPTLRKRITDWFQQFVYSINQPAGARNYQSPFVNIAYFDKYYFEAIFEDFVFPDGDEPNWETTKELEKLFMSWFNEERRRDTITFPVESFNVLVVDKQYADSEMADFAAEMWSKGHSFFMYQSDSADSLSSCCRLRNGIVDNVFSTSLGAGGIETGSKCVITLNLNRLVQEWYNTEYLARTGMTLGQYIADATTRTHKYLNAWNAWLFDLQSCGMLPVYDAGFIQLDRQYLTVGVNGFVEAAEFLESRSDKPADFADIKVSPYNAGYKNLAHEILGTIKQVNRQDRDEHHMYNTEFVPGENCAAKLYQWDKRDGYVVPAGRNLYNSYFYVVEDPTVSPVDKFYYQGDGFATECDGGVALHNNLSEILSKDQYRKLMDIAVDAGCNYFTYNIPSTICNDCGFRSKEYYTVCPECGSENIDHETRIIGYLRRISNFSQSRKIEAARRFYAGSDMLKSLE